MSSDLVKNDVVEYGRRKGSSKKAVNSEMEKPAVDLRQIVVLPSSEWQRLQDRSVGVNRHERRVMEESERRAALHVRSKELVKNWPNTIAGQRQKKLEAKKIREAIQEEERKLLDLEEAKYQAQKRQEAIEKATTLQYYQTDRVKGFHSALMLAEVLKEREAQIKLKRHLQESSKHVDQDVLIRMAREEEEALQEKKQEALQRKQDQLNVAEGLQKQVKEQELKKNLERIDRKREAEEIQRLQELHLWEELMSEQKKQEEKREMLKSHRDQLEKRETMKASETQRQEEEEKIRKLMSEHKKRVMKMRKDKQEEMIRETQRKREMIIEKLAEQKEQKISNEDEIIDRAVAEMEARRMREHLEKEEKHQNMLNSIVEHRENMRQDQKRKAEEEKHHALETLNAEKEADRIFKEKLERKAQKAREERKALQDTYILEMAEKNARHKITKQEQKSFVEKNALLLVEEEKQFQNYAKQVIDTAEKAGRNIYPLVRAAREGIGGGLGPVFGGLRPSFPTQDQSGVQLPSFTRKSSQNVKELNATTDLQESKKRLGFT